MVNFHIIKVKVVKFFLEFFAVILLMEKIRTAPPSIYLLNPTKEWGHSPYQLVSQIFSISLHTHTGLRYRYEHSIYSHRSMDNRPGKPSWKPRSPSHLSLWESAVTPKFELMVDNHC